MSNKLRVAVLGGGVIGVTSALRVIESVRDVEVTLMSLEFSPNTTGDGSAGLWLPYALGSAVSGEKLNIWCKESLDFFLKIAKSAHSKNYGVGFLPFHYIAEEKSDIPVYMDKIMGTREMSPDELSIYPSKYKYGKCGTTIYAECKKLLPKLTERFHAMGGLITRRKVHKLNELIGEYDIVVNCTGLQSAFLVPDPDLYPVRGQVVKVNAPWIKHCVMEKDLYIIPNTDVVTLGGTRQKEDWNTNVNNDDKKTILEGTAEILPSLKEAELLSDWVGLRPGRESPRLERDTLSRNSTLLHVVHNYGHGGSGVTLAWGCAGDVVNFVKDIMKEIKIESRL